MADGWRKQISERSGKALQDAMAEEEEGEGEEAEEYEEGSDDDDDELEDVDGSWEALDQLEVSLVRAPTFLARRRQRNAADWQRVRIAAPSRPGHRGRARARAQGEGG